MSSRRNTCRTSVWALVMLLVMSVLSSVASAEPNRTALVLEGYTYTILPGNDIVYGDNLVVKARRAGNLLDSITLTTGQEQVEVGSPLWQKMPTRVPVYTWRNAYPDVLPHLFVETIDYFPTHKNVSGLLLIDGNLIGFVAGENVPTFDTVRADFLEYQSGTTFQNDREKPDLGRQPGSESDSIGVMHHGSPHDVNERMWDQWNKTIISAIGPANLPPEWGFRQYEFRLWSQDVQDTLSLYSAVDRVWIELSESNGWINLDSSSGYPTSGVSNAEVGISYLAFSVTVKFPLTGTDFTSSSRWAKWDMWTYGGWMGDQTNWPGNVSQDKGFATRIKMATNQSNVDVWVRMDGKYRVKNIVYDSGYTWWDQYHNYAWFVVKAYE